MEFIPELTAFQGVIISADNVHSFSRLTARGGNEDQIDYIIENLLRFLEQQNYISQNALCQEKLEEMQKFALYIILNSDLPALEQLAENDCIDSVIWTVPIIPRCLMSEMLWKLHMEQFVYEAIAFCNPQLALELANTLIDNIKYFTPSESLQKIKILSSSLYKLICRLHFFEFESLSFRNMLAVALNNVQNCLNYFMEPPNSHKLVNLKKDALYKFKGKTLETIFHLIYESLNEYTSVEQFSPTNFNEIYQLTYAYGSYEENPLNFTICNSPNETILDCLDKCNEYLLDICKALVMDVSVDIFCAWSEFEEEGKSMQQTIGELCYKLRTKLLSISVIAEHPVVGMLQQISRKPLDLQELIDFADTDTILKNIQNNDDDQPKWVKALISRDVSQDGNVIDTLVANLDVLNEEDSHNLYKNIIKCLDQDSDYTEKMKSLAIKAFQKCSHDNKIEILEDNFKGKCLHDVMETLEFQDMMTVIFNKVTVEEQSDLTSILAVFLQNPQTVYTKMFNLSAESSQATEIMLKAMVVLEKFSNHYYRRDTEPCIVRIAETVLEDYLEKEITQQNFIKFICGLKSANVIPGTKLLLLIIMPKMHSALLEKDVSRIHFQCKLLSAAFTLDELMAYRAPMLAMMAQVLEVVRWKITTFVPEGPIALQLALDLQKKLIDTYGDIIPVKEVGWLKSKLQRLQPLNCYYYRKLWNPPGENLVEIVSGTTVSIHMNSQRLQSWMSQVLCVTTQQEWCEIWDSLAKFTDSQRLNILLNVLTVLTVTEAHNRREGNSWQCILQCYRNLIFVIRYKYFKEPLTDLQVTTVVQKISNTANFIQENASEAISSTMLPLFVYIVTRKGDYKVDVFSFLNKYLRNKVYKEVVSKVFTNEAAGIADT